jgi:hypothetical protein
MASTLLAAIAQPLVRAPGPGFSLQRAAMADLLVAVWPRVADEVRALADRADAGAPLPPKD